MVTQARDVAVTPSQLLAVRSVGIRENLADIAYGTLREAITDGTLPPGYRLREVPLSRHLGVSTTPIREALRRLEREGLVEISPRRGALVRPLDWHEIHELYDLRELLEGHALGKAVDQQDLDLSRARSIIEEAARVIGEPEQVQFNRLDVEFHHSLTVAGGNQELAEVATRVHRRIQGIRVRFSIQLQGRPARSHAEHIEIVDALARRDRAHADGLIRAHIRGVRDAVLSVLSRGSENRPAP